MRSTECRSGFIRFRRRGCRQKTSLPFDVQRSFFTEWRRLAETWLLRLGSVSGWSRPTSTGSGDKRRSWRRSNGTPANILQSCEARERGDTVASGTATSSTISGCTDTAISYGPVAANVCSLDSTDVRYGCPLPQRFAVTSSAVSFPSLRGLPDGCSAKFCVAATPSATAVYFLPPGVLGNRTVPGYAGPSLVWRRTASRSSGVRIPIHVSRSRTSPIPWFRSMPVPAKMPGASDGPSEVLWSASFPVARHRTSTAAGSHLYGSGWHGENGQPFGRRNEHCHLNGRSDFCDEG